MKVEGLDVEAGEARCSLFWHEMNQFAAENGRGLQLESNPV